jgi:hypothetical protein
LAPNADDDAQHQAVFCCQLLVGNDSSLEVLMSMASQQAALA